MPNVNIPTTSTTQTLTGDNGVTTEASFTANGLEGAFFGRTGVGLRGSSYASFGESALDVAFSDAVENVQFTLFDVDQATGNGGWDDQVRVEAYDLAGNPIPITFTTTSAGHIAEQDGSTGELQIEASNVTTDDQSSIVVSIAGPVGSFRIFYEDGNSETNNTGVINLEALSFTNAIARDGTVSGTTGDDLIDGSYAGDPNGDVVDNGDAILPGDTGDDDLIFGNAGNDSILAGEGADEVYGGSGNDTIDGGASDDLLVGDQTTAVNGDDTITGGTGNDTIYGDNTDDTGATASTTTFNWSGLGLSDGADVSDGISGASANGDITVSLSVEAEDNFTYAQMETTDLLYDYNGVDDNSSIMLRGGTAGTSGDAATATINFEAAQPGYFNGVENVTFGISDIDRLGGQFRDEVVIRAYDIDGNLIPVTLTPGNAATLTTSTDANGVATATATATAPSGSVDDIDGFLQIDVAGPVARIEIDYNNVDPAFGNHSINIGDLTFDTIPIDDSTGGGNDSLDGGIGDDTLFGGDGEDTFTSSAGNDTNFGGTGNDAFEVSDNSDAETITGGEDVGNGDIDTVDFASPSSSAGVTVDFNGSESGTYTFDGTTAAGSFSEIERIDATAFDDTIDASDNTSDITILAGSGEDTITSGQGDDTIDLSPTGAATPDGEDDVIVLADGFGSDTVLNFDAPTPNGDGSFTGNDTFDVTGLNDANTVPVNTNDVVVTDDGSGNAVLNFPNGETVTLDGITPAEADDPLYLNAIGIPLPPPDGIVTGTQSADVIDAGYNGDLEGDLVDAGDELLAGEGPNDDIIVAQGGDDSITAGVGNDDIYGGDGADTIDAGAGDDIVYGDTASGAWFYEYYDLDPTGDPRTLAQAGFAEDTADFEGVPTEVGYTDTINPTAFDAGDDYALKFTSVLTVTAAGDYTFETASDDGSKLFINGIEVVDNDGHHGVISVSGTPITLPAGDHVIEIIYYENNGGNAMTASVSGPDTGNVFTDLATYDGLRAATGDDIITGGAGDDTLFGGGDSDTFNVAANDDTDTMTGGEDTDGLDIDTVSFDTVGTTDGVNVTFNGDEEGTYLVGAAGSDGDFADIERIVGTDNDDTVDLTADTSGITVESGTGDDTVTSGFGNDVISTGTGQDDIVINDDFGNDDIDGGTGADGTGDVLDGSGLSQDVTVDFAASETGTVDNGTDTLDFNEIEAIVTGSGDDTVLGDIGDDVVSTGAGTDTLSGGAGDDTFDAGAGNDTIAGGIGDDSITAGTGDDTIVVNDTFGNDTIAGGSDAGDTDTDILDGSGLTEDVVVDLSAPETGTITNGTDTTSFTEIEEIITGAGNDTVTGGAGGDTVSTGSGEDEVTFSNGDDIDTGADDDLLILTTTGPTSNGNITIDGGDEERDAFGNLIGDGDTLQLGDLADLSTLVTTTDPDGSFSGSVQLDDGTTLTFTDIERIICFTPGTTIATPKGARPIETLKVGDMVVTRDHGLQPIRWIQSRTVAATGKFAPVRIRPGAVTGLETDLLVSPQHRMLFTGYRAELLFGEREVLMPAIHLVDDKLVTRETGGDVTYIHMMFDHHEVVYADGAATESFHPGEEGLHGITGAAREELFALFPELRSNPMGYGPAARRCLKKHETQMLQVL